MPMTAIAAAAAAFNLVCSGTMHISAMPSDSDSAFTYVFRIDLDKMLVCDGECKATRPIVEVTPTSIVLDRKDSDTPRKHVTSNVSISRETGVYTGSASESGGLLGPFLATSKAQCERAPFTGFPLPASTKF